MKRVEYILEFTLRLGEKMLQSGANLERVNDTMIRVMRSYELEEISVFSLNYFFTVSAKTKDGEVSTMQRYVENTGIHLARLSRMNQLSRRICLEKPEPDVLEALLREAEQVPEYSPLTVCFGFVLALTCLTFIFNGSVRDVAAVDVITVVLYLMSIVLKKPGVNHIVYNVLCTFIAGTMALYFVKWGVGTHVYTVMIVTSMVMIPGIPLVNSIRNILCGNEMNGILELLKVAMETLAIVGGFVLSIFLFGGTTLW